ncbi:hypothetical protein EIP86_005864 [Pleurotus ostreatoroseus]|nr:hypothetical protein EIP86_005864 [Pleurotus ostreatoroseus]
MSSNRVWVITGVNSGLGFALATHVASQGDKVIGSVRLLSKFPEALREIGVTPIVVDFSAADEDIKEAARSALKVLGKVDVLVNNAGIGMFGPVEELQLSDIRKSFQTNVFGIIAFTQPFIEYFRTRRIGHILSLSSIVGTDPAPSWAAYNASKAALEAFMDSLHHELKNFGVRVLLLVPGYFSSSFFHNLPNVPQASSPVAAPSDQHDQGSKIYTDPLTQGFGSDTAITKMHIEQGQIGDPAKYAARVYEVVTGTGLVQQAGVIARTVNGSWEGPWEMNRVPLGRDCGERLAERLRLLQENVELYKPITESTDVEKERLKYFPRG